MNRKTIFDIALALVLWLLGEMLYRKVRRRLRARKKVAPQIYALYALDVFSRAEIKPYMEIIGLY